MKTTLKNVVMLVLGNLILAFGVTFFILPNNILSGGVAGVAIALYPIFHIEVEVMINIIIVISFLLGFVFLGKRFALKTIGSSILYPVFINLFGRFEFSVNVDPILAAIYGGILIGVGLGLTFKTGASTGGMDIPPLILEKYTNIRVAVWILVVDALTVLLGLKSYSLNDVLIGFISIYAASLAIDKIAVLGGEQARQVTVISEKNEEILEHLHSAMERGSTLLRARGGYTRLEKEIVMTVVTKKQYYELEQIVLEVDPDAFMIVSNVTEVHGLGFKKA
ncbi:YitT family protein [Erysipelothrix sp. HDW6C]|uniref:YitT family protein n=1 Tax=Erysipelothrix sp. HDW6C TaxID=2714930 RepID=UPI001F104651|nr:YitT family protein [Erysipelothrix sp. HDW6C]